MSKVNLWNTISLAQTGRVKLLDSGRELFGTVIKHGVNDKTITVRVSSRHFNHKYKKALYSNKSKQVHDETNYCVTGDKVIIANCSPISITKAYYVKTIVKPFSRPMAPKEGQLTLQASTSVENNPATLKKEQKTTEVGQKTQETVKQAKRKEDGKQKNISTKDQSREKKNSKSGEKTEKESKSQSKKLNEASGKGKTKKSDLVV